MLMTRELPIEQSENHFLLKVDTETLKETFNAERVYINEFLSDGLGTSKFEISVEVSEIPVEDKARFISNPKDKYEHMLAINPKLSDFMKKLGLDFDY